MKFKTSLFIFRRDLRLEDNTGLIYALKHSERVIPAFIFTPEQIEHNPFRSDHCLKFMLESLEDLQNQLKEKGGRLYLFKGKPEEIVARCISELSIDALIVNRDYTPYSIKRDENLEKACKERQVSFISCEDALLNPPEETLKKDGKPYTIFTPYFRNALKIQVMLPIKNTESNYFQGKIPFADSLIPFPKTINLLKGGRNEALKILTNLRSFNGSTHLSAYLKFTVCSPREVYAAISSELNPHHELIRALYWRDFFTSIAFFFPHVFTSAFQAKYDKVSWSYDKDAFLRWCKGRTGFPIVDAGMREMNETGFMHNRVRMITASFLTKDLLIDWRWGEKYFAQNLIDYDPAVNNGNWQWAASTGCDAQAHFRIFNPWTQQKKFDPECLYIKKWVPELQNFSPKVIHEWDSMHSDGAYPSPIVDHKQASKEALLAYSKNSK